MDTTDKNIKKIFSTYNKKFDVDLEESIMNEISVQKDYSTELLHSKKRVKTGITLATLFLMGYFIITYFDTFSGINKKIGVAELFTPAIFTAMLSIIMYFLLTYNSSINNPQKN